MVMLRFARSPSVTDAVYSFALVAMLAGCGEAATTPFFEQGAQSGASSGGAAGSATGGSSTGGRAGSGGVGGVSGRAGSGGTGGTGSGGVAGSSGGTGGTGVGACSSADPAAASFENHCYLYRSTPATFALAKEDCSARGAHLVVLGSDGRNEVSFAAENDFVWALSGRTDVWIGATDGRPSNQPGNGTPYSWINGEILLYDRWAAEQPNFASCGTSCWEHCASMSTEATGAWNDRHCEQQIAYVCEWFSPPM